MADQGSQEILDLLNQQSDQLGSSIQTFIEAYRKTGSRDYAIPPQDAFDALAEIQQYMRGVREQIGAVDTQSPAKQDVLDALDAFDRSLNALELGLSKGVTHSAIKKLKGGKGHASDAKRILNQSIGGLST